MTNVSGVRLGALLLISCVILVVSPFFSGSSVLGTDSYRNGFSKDPSFFPIGVWLQPPSSAHKYKEIGINTYVGLWNGPTEIQLSELAQSDMHVVAEQNSTGLTSPNQHVIKAWMQPDEPDNAQPIGLGLYGTCIAANEVVRRSRLIRSLDSTRPILINFGQGVANDKWHGRGPCTGDQNYYKTAARDADILSFDIYPVGSTNTPEIKGKLEYVARGVSRLATIATSNQDVWAVLETTALDPSRRVTPHELRAETWMSIIHGAKGIVYFVHEFSPSLREDAIFRYPEILAEVRKNNHIIKSLAPVINSSNVPGKINVEARVPIAITIKQHDDLLYIFAVAMKNELSQARFLIEGHDGKNAIVIGEDRKVAIQRGVLEDMFEGYDVHIYKIPIGQRSLRRSSWSNELTPTRNINTK